MYGESIPYEFLESELFGYASGAFAGAQQQGKPGKTEQADDGTLFLDEIGEVPFRAQGELRGCWTKKGWRGMGRFCPRIPRAISSKRN